MTDFDIGQSCKRFLIGPTSIPATELTDIDARCAERLENLWPEYKRDLNPQKYPVDLSQKLWDNKMNLIKAIHEYVKKIDFDNQ